MSVVGLGLDVVGLAGFAAQIEDRASGFVAATFTAAEQAVARSSTTPVATALAGGFAAKEAFVKAWSSARAGHAPALAEVALTEIEVVHDSFGRPALRLLGAVADAFAATMTDLFGGPPAVMVSITHDEPVAAAVVVLST